MQGLIKWHRFDGEGYVIHSNQSYYFHCEDEIFDKDVEVEFDLIRILDLDVAINVRKRGAK